MATVQRYEGGEAIAFRDERTDRGACPACQHDQCSCPCVVCDAYVAAAAADPTIERCDCPSCVSLRRVTAAAVVRNGGR
jgi:hypothetical protein